MERRWAVTYQVYCGTSLIFETGVDELRITTPVLDLELGKTGSFEFTIYQDHPNYSAVEPMATVRVDRNYQTIYTGRVLSIQYGLYNEKQVSCEGELAFLLDVLIKPYAYKGSVVLYFEYIVAQYNASVEADRRFVVGNVTVAEYAPFYSTETEYKTAFDILQNKIITPTGGYLQVRNEGGVRYLDLLSPEANGTASSQPIELGKNLLDLKREFNGADVFSAIIPFGAKIRETEARLDVMAVNGGVGFLVNAEAKKFCKGLIYREVIFDGLTNANTLKAEAEAYLANNYAGEYSIEVTAADLSGQDASLDFFRVGQWVNVFSNYHFDTPQLFLIKKLTINLLSPAENKIVIGKVKKGFTQAVAELSNSVNSISVPEAVQPYVMESGTTGIWTWKKFSDNTCEFFGKIPVTDGQTGTAFGGWYRSGALYEATDYPYPLDMTEAPSVQLTFQTRNANGAFLWPFSDTAENARQYLPQCYLVKPTAATGILGNINVIGKGKVSA